MFRVIVKAIIINNKRILTVKRASAEEFAPDRWEFPGGRLEKGEGIKEGLLREIKEETGLDCEIIRILYASDFTSEHTGDSKILAYLCSTDDYEVVLSHEHDDYKWADKHEMRQIIFSEILDDLETHHILELEELNN
ncbi:8-oxo-dGTP diphosphatase [Dethiosulfatibacter aminovorans DSM 17477]|uniref:8-oxo-dGTP diphosphatase n=1 Tax=Dethiosulfatibacter aminovorans DSM 17477 TaxID=1121476 RepID=A0A1M6HNG5_9FIRM|nr:NUDIX domain-containing protein [Dethiosulfatibacter aminovorans]SHJ23684.1 8-oxo-dGTP diphosphatase [Dethiosulfatibacter aminovorans DSM 17477]